MSPAIYAASLMDRVLVVLYLIYFLLGRQKFISKYTKPIATCVTDVTQVVFGGGGGTAGSIPFDMGWTIPSPVTTYIATGESVLWCYPP